MFANMKVRTCLAVVLLSFLGALMLSSVSAWYSVQSTHSKLESVNNVYTDEVSPLYEAYNEVLRARVLLTSTFLTLQNGEGGDLSGAAKRAGDYLASAKRNFERFSNFPRDADAAEAADSVGVAFNLYQASLAAQIKAIDARSIDEFMVVNKAAGNNNEIFNTAARAFIGHMDTATDGMVDGARADFLTTRIVMLAIAGLSVLLAIGCWIFMSRTVLKPLGRAAGHFDRIAGGDMTGQIDVRSSNEIGTLFAGLQRMQQALSNTVARVRSGVEEINVGSREIADGNNDLSSRTEQQAASLEETAASMEQLASTVKQNADNAAQANGLAAGASAVAARGGEAVAEVVQTMSGISTSSRKIAEIVGVIDSIAFQTNILALNAAVEAARAGEQGKGFAVVAAEVRSLAQRSAQAAREIKGLIDDSVEKVSAGSMQVESAGATMQEIVVSVKRVSDIIAEIAAASQEQSGGIDQVNKAVSQMDEVTQQNAALVEQAAAAAGALQSQAQSLAEAVAVFRIAGSHEQTCTVATLNEAPVTRTLAQRVAPAVRKTRELVDDAVRHAGPALAAPVVASVAFNGASSAALARVRVSREPVSRATPARQAASAPRAITPAVGAAAPANTPAARGSAIADDDWETF